MFSESYQYDDIGNIEFVTNNGVTTTYFYDSLNQLTKASSSDGTVTKYFYNDGGNINYKVNADGSKTHYVYDTEWKDLLVSFGGQSITYDEIGNPISYLGNTMSWTGRTLDSITKADGTQISYTYDLNGIRTAKTVGGITTEYFVNGTTILAQKTGDNVIWYIYDSDDEILGFTYNDTPYYYVKNLQGDVLKVIDANGNVVASYTYDPWGKITSSTGTMADINPIRYRGYYYDNETGLYYLNSRYYDPDTCRFINADSLIDTTTILGFNMFTYCLNNPVNMSDTTGKLAFFAITAIVGAVVGAVVGGVKAAKSGGSVWKGALVGAAVGGLVGAGLGAAASVLLAGSAVASTTSVAIGAKALISVVGSAGVFAGVKMLADNVSQACSNVTQVFWSGGEVAKKAAEQVANEIGGKTLEMTRIGAYLEQINASYSAWQAASSNFANVASNSSSVIYSIQNISGVGIQSIWATIEYPLLQGKEIIYGVVLQSGLIQIMP